MSTPSSLSTSSPEALAVEWFAAHDLATSPSLTIPLVDPDYVVLAQLVVDRTIAEATSLAKLGAGKAEPMRRIVDKLTTQVLDAVDVGEFDPAELLREVSHAWSGDQRRLFLIELTSTTPFAPYEVQTAAAKTENAYRHVAKIVGAEAQLDEVLASTKAARKAHTKTNWAKAGVFGVGAALVIGAGGFLAAPMMGAALGSAAGLSGAAATSHGLALLGGGTLASGGMGMSGGIWMVTGAAAATGGSLTNAGLALQRMGASQYLHELVKLQVSYDLLLSKNVEHTATAQAVSAQLATQVTELTTQLDAERELNDANSRRVQELADKLNAVKAAVRWTDTIDEGSGCGPLDQPLPA